MAEPEDLAETSGFAFEGDLIHDLEGKLPAMTVEMPEAYNRGTVLRLQVEVRVKSVRHEENRKGDLVRQHVFALESINLVSSYKPEDARDSVGGSASSAPAQTTEDVAELGGLEIGRSSDSWGGEPVQVREGSVDTATGEMFDPEPESVEEPVSVGF